VVGGRWKPLHYWLKSHLFAAFFSACDASGACVVRNDDPLAPLNATLTITAVSTVTGAPLGALSAPRAVALRRGAGALGWSCLDGAGAPPACAPPAAALARAGCAANGTDCAVVTVLTDAASGAELARNLQFWAVPSLLRVARGVTVATAVGAPAPDGSVPVTLTVGGGAALLVLRSSCSALSLQRPCAALLRSTSRAAPPCTLMVTGTLPSAACCPTSALTVTPTASCRAEGTAQN